MQSFDIHTFHIDASRKDYIRLLLRERVMAATGDHSSTCQRAYFRYCSGFRMVEVNGPY